MPVTYVNRRGDTYYLIRGQTKTGKAKYHFSKKASEHAVDEIPAGYEIYEKPDTPQVFLRKPISTRIEPLEVEFARRLLQEHAGVSHTLVDVEKDSLVVYAADDNDLKKLMAVLGDRTFDNLAAKDQVWLKKRLQFEKLLRFTLVDDQQRLFLAERWCFRGSIDDWIHVGFRPASLERLIASLAPHLGQESFYEIY
jgi:hypothetical protein